MKNPYKIKAQLQEKIDHMIAKVLANTPYASYQKDVRGYIADVKRGRAYSRDSLFTVPYWAYKPDHPKNLRSNGGYFTYYVAHELSHLIVFKEFGGSANHDARFYEIFRIICPEEYQHFELDYIKNAFSTP